MAACCNGSHDRKQGQVEDGSLELRKIPTRVEPRLKSREMIDLGVVYKARTVQENRTYSTSARGTAALMLEGRERGIDCVK